MCKHRKHYVVQKFVRISLQQLQEELFRCDTLFSLVFHNNVKGFKNHVLGLSSENLHVKDRDGWSLLHYAVLVNAGEIVTHLIQSGVDPNLLCEARAFSVSGWRAVHIAAEMGNAQLLSQLLKLGANPELFLNVNADEVESAKQGSKNVKTDGWNALHLAVYSHNVDAVKVLLDAGVYREARTRHSRCTPLMIAAKYSNTDALSLFLQNPSTDISALDAGHGTLGRFSALRHAAKSSSTSKAVGILLAADASETNNDEDTLLPSLIGRCSTEIADKELRIALRNW